MRTQIAKTWYLPAEYIPPTFWLLPPYPYSAGWRWGLLSRKIFSNFIFLILSRNLVNGFLRLNTFFIFSDFVIILVWFWLSDYRLIVSIFNLLILARFGYAWLSSSTRLISLDIPCLFFVIFSPYQFRLVSALSIIRFASSTLYLFCLL